MRSCLLRLSRSARQFARPFSSNEALTSEITSLPPAQDSKNRDQNGMRVKAKKGWNWVRPKPQSVPDALSLLQKAQRSKFVQSLEIAVNLNLDTRQKYPQAEQNLRGSVMLAHSVGKSVRVAVFASGAKAQEALAAGATIVGAEDLVERVKQGFLDFDRCIATPDMMPTVGKVARILGPKGLMPNPKMGTVTNDVATFIRGSASGVPYKADKAGTIHARIGRMDSDTSQLEANVLTFVRALRDSKPRGVKEPFIKSVYLSSTMGPGVPLIVSGIDKPAKR